MTKISEHVLNTARRVASRHQELRDVATEAHAEWQHKMTLSNAMWRDDTKQKLLEHSDANTLALVILQLAGEPFPPQKASGDTKVFI